MEYQTIINLLDNTSDQHSRFRTRNWVEMNHEESMIIVALYLKLQ